MIYFLIIFIASAIFLHYENKKQRDRIREILTGQRNPVYDRLNKMVGGEGDANC